LTNAARAKGKRKGEREYNKLQGGLARCSRGFMSHMAPTSNFEGGEKKKPAIRRMSRPVIGAECDFGKEQNEELAYGAWKGTRTEGLKLRHYSLDTWV